MKKTAIVVLLAVASVWNAASAQDVLIQIVQSDGKKKKEHKAEEPGIVTLRVSVQNLAQAPITVRYIGAGSGAFLAKVQDREIEPASEALFSMIVDNDALGVPSNVEVAVGYTLQDQLKTARTLVTLSAPDVMVFSPGFLTWKVGDALEEKSATISIPKFVKIVRAMEVEGFDTRIEGDKIYIKPVRTDKAKTAGVRVLTAPGVQANRSVPLFLSIAQ